MPSGKIDDIKIANGPIRKSARSQQQLLNFTSNIKDKVKDKDDKDILMLIYADMNFLKEAAKSNDLKFEKIENKVTALQTSVIETLKTELDKRDQQWKDDRMILENRIAALEQREEARAKTDKKNNIVIFGLNISKINCKQQIADFLLDKLGVNSVILEVRVIKKLKDGKDTNIFIVKLASYDDKANIMKEKKKLKGSDVFIHNDLSLNERETQRKLSKFAEEKKASGSLVRVAHLKIYVDGNEWIWKDDGPTLVNREKKLSDVATL